MFDWAERSPSTRQQVGAFLRERGLRPQAAAANSRTAPAVTATCNRSTGCSRRLRRRPGRDAPRKTCGDRLDAVARLVEGLARGVARGLPHQPGRRRPGPLVGTGPQRSADPAAVSRSRRRQSRSEARTLSEERRQAGRFGAGARTHGAVRSGSGQVAGLLHASYFRSVAQRGTGSVSAVEQPDRRDDRPRPLPDVGTQPGDVESRRAHGGEGRRGTERLVVNLPVPAEAK